MGNSSLYISKTESWDQVVYKVSLKVNRPQGSKSIVYNEFGGEITSVAELEDGDKVFFAVDGEPFVPPKIQGNVFCQFLLLSRGCPYCFTETFQYSI